MLMLKPGLFSTERGDLILWAVLYNLQLFMIQHGLLTPLLLHTVHRSAETISKNVFIPTAA